MKTIYCIFCSLLISTFLLSAGCESPNDLFEVSSNELIDSNTELGHQACQLLLPFAKALTKGDYEAAYDALDPMVFKDVHARQFVRSSPRMEISLSNYKYVGDPDDRIGDVDKATFVKMLKTEESKGKLSGTFEIIEEWSYVDEGEKMQPSKRRYSSAFPFDKVVASVTVMVDCVIDEKAIKTYEMPPEFSDADLYFNIFALVIKEDEKLKVGFVDLKEMHLDY